MESNKELYHRYCRHGIRILFLKNLITYFRNFLQFCPSYTVAMPTTSQENVLPVGWLPRGVYCLDMARTVNSSRPDRNSQTSQNREEGFTPYKSYVVLWFISTLCYANSLTGEFVFDDHEVIVTNVDIR